MRPSVKVELDDPPLVPIIPDFFSIPLPKHVSLEVKRTPARDGEPASTLVRVEAKLGLAMFYAQLLKAGKKSDVEFGVVIRACRLKDLLAEINNVFPGLIPDILTGANGARATLGMTPAGPVHYSTFPVNFSVSLAS